MKIQHARFPPFRCRSRLRCRFAVPVRRYRFCSSVQCTPDTVTIAAAAAICLSSSASWSASMIGWPATEQRQRKQESRAVARKSRDAAAVLFGLKFADNIHYKFNSRQASKAMLQSSTIAAQNRI